MATRQTTPTTHHEVVITCPTSSLRSAWVAKRWSAARVAFRPPARTLCALGEDSGIVLTSGVEKNKNGSYKHTNQVHWTLAKNGTKKSSSLGRWPWANIVPLDREGYQAKEYHLLGTSCALKSCDTAETKSESIW